ncbi:FAD-dependent oxidoreductase [Phytohabitans houttuyneae]|uniref:FAD/NAD(P)-binding oxidoreductase n=1 Tax=Phytohabitans houttuyneae TaxID=1076126 RepID=A0A6V8K9C9_9ACTN|nr:FAD-dependent oxidoreductase [Phytohabitans houttuyneae]GFJ78958.1 FAD/NAD(P)-binding oxidoreductase [Phytohabitans houttuyneae]
MNVVVVGYGMAGSRLAAELRDRGPHMKITVLGAERHRAYNRIMLSSVLAGKVRERDVEITEAAGHGIDLRPGVVVTAIDRAARMVTTGDGDRIEYDHLVLATGSRALIPPLTGLDREHLPERVAVFRTLDDCRRILATASEARSALVLGGGLLGLEAARGLAARGIATEVVHAVGHLMERQLDPGASAVLVRTLSGLGITAHLDAMAASVAADADGVTLGLADGRELRADLLVVACGVRPETGLAGDAGLAVERGIVVDDHMRTSDPHISAIGDCAQHDGVVSGLVAPAWEQARIVARVLGGEDPLARYRPLPVVTRLKAAGIDLAAMGTSGPAEGAEGAEELSFADPVRGTYAKLTIVGERLTGAIMLGDNPSVGAVIQLFDRGSPVPTDRRALLLGRAIGVPAATQAESPALMPDAATVCQCNTVSKGALVRCWRAGARSVDDVVAATRATTGCGTCRDAVEGIVDWLSTVDSPEVAA